MNPWILAARPKTLSAAVAPVVVGTALALRDRRDVPLFYALAALLGAVLIQVATNYINDALDFRRGADTAARLGPTRVTQAGLLSDEKVLAGAYLCFALAAACGIPLILRGGWPIVVIGLASIAAAWAYTGGPYPLAYHGLGELFVLVFFGFVAVGGTYYVLTLRYGADAFFCGLAVGSLSVVLLAINNLRDLQTDRESGKKTMAVMMGERGARAEIIAFTLIPYVVIGLLALLRSDCSLWLVFLSLPLALALIRRVRHGQGAELNRGLAMAGTLQWVFAILFAAGWTAWR